MKECRACHHTYRGNSCSQCRTNEQAQRLGLEIETCHRCRRHAPLHSNGECKRCLVEQGLKECSVCRRIRKYDLDFYDHRSACKNCSTGKTSPRLAKYGITQDEYEACIEAQNGQCGICGRDTPLVIDHNHQTREFRGLLCRSCNVGIGYFRDSERHLIKAIEYLRATETRDRVAPVEAHSGFRHLARIREEQRLEVEKLRNDHLQELKTLEARLRPAYDTQSVKEWLMGLQAFLRNPGPENPAIRLQLVGSLQKRIDSMQ